ncbi:MAG: Ig-like domain-containing protein [Candidatus Sericytochromatia bacterium]|nr:Ig-like domain-containing protein [Candidatus Tanganyikabacteria bacterium]
MRLKANLAAGWAAAALLTACLPNFNLFGAGLPIEVPSDLPSETPTVPPVTVGFGGEPSTRTPTPGPPATPLPTQPPQVARAVEVTILADGVPVTENGSPKGAITLNRLPREGVIPIFAVKKQLSVSVLLSNGILAQKASWKSSRPDTAAVDENGLVTAGNATGSTDIVATSEDGKASASAKVTLTDDGAADVVID